MNEAVGLKELSGDGKRKIRHLMAEARIGLKTVRHYADVLLNDIDQNGSHASLALVRKELARLLEKLVFLSGEIEATRQVTACMETIARCQQAGKRPRMKHVAHA